jgi:hypothetical protein
MILHQDEQKASQLTLVDFTEDDYAREFGLGIVGHRWVPGKHALISLADGRHRVCFPFTYACFRHPWWPRPCKILRSTFWSLTMVYCSMFSQAAANEHKAL